MRISINTVGVLARWRCPHPGFGAQAAAAAAAIAGTTRFPVRTAEQPYPSKTSTIRQMLLSQSLSVTTH